MPKGISTKSSFLPVVLFALTALTTTISGALYAGANPFEDPWALAKGLTFSIPLLLILGTHELGHYIASRLHRVETTLPLFIPGPPIPPMIGTFGAVIKIRSPITTKRALVDIGAAGPLSGFVVALATTAWGITGSTVVPRPEGEFMGVGSSLLFEALTRVVHGPIPEGYDLLLNPVAFAGWIGLFITSINLLPVGQLDGGHIVYAFTGESHRKVSMGFVAALALLGLFAWQGWIMWALLVTLLGLWHPPTHDAHAPIDPKRKLVSALTLAVFVLTFIPTPFYIV